MLRNFLGYSLFEFLMILALLAALLLMAIPAWQDMLAQNRVTIVVNQLRSAIYFARSEAMKRGVTVTLCKSKDQISCGGDWSNGQIVFLDWDNNGQVRSTRDVLRVFDGLPAGSSLVWKGRLGIENYLQIKPSTVTEVPNGRFIYCPAYRKNAYAREIVVSSTGRIHVIQSQLYCSSYENINQ